MIITIPKLFVKEKIHNICVYNNVEKNLENSKKVNKLLNSSERISMCIFLNCMRDALFTPKTTSRHSFSIARRYKREKN